MASKSIGTLAALITADATQFAAEFKRADNIVARSSTEWQKELGHGLKFGVGLLGAQSVFKLLEEEVKHVIDDINDIPGISPETVSSVNEAKVSFKEFRSLADNAISGVIGFAATAAKSIGALFAVIHGADVSDITDGLSKLDSPDAVARQNDDKFDEKIAASAASLRSAQRALQEAGATRIQQVNQLMAEAARYNTYANSSSLDQVQKLDAETDSVKKQTEAKKLLAQIGQETADVWQREKAQLDDISRIGKPATQSLAQLTAQHWALVASINALTSAQLKGDKSPETAEKLLKANKELLQVDADRIPLLKKQAEIAKQFGDTFGSALDDAVFSGQNLHDVLTGLIKDLAKLVFQQTISQPIANWISGFKFFAGGGDPPVGVPSVVGEKGPELFVPRTAGTIIPNHVLNKSSGGGQGGGTYYIDARGADRTGLARLESMIRSVDGSVEHRAIAAVADKRRRGGG